MQRGLALSQREAGNVLSPLSNVHLPQDKQTNKQTKFGGLSVVWVGNRSKFFRNLFLMIDLSTLNFKQSLHIASNFSIFLEVPPG